MQWMALIQGIDSFSISIDSLDDSFYEKLAPFSSEELLILIKKIKPADFIKYIDSFINLPQFNPDRNPKAYKYLLVYAYKHAPFPAEKPKFYASLTHEGKNLFNAAIDEVMPHKLKLAQGCLALFSGNPSFNLLMDLEALDLYGSTL